MNLARIAARIAIPTTAGPTLDMVRDENLDGGGGIILYQKADDELSAAGIKDWRQKEKILETAVFSALEKASPGASSKIPDSIRGQVILHEVDHLLFEPTFDLIGGVSGRGEVESAMDEAFISAKDGYTDDVPEGVIDPSYPLLVGDSETIAEALSNIAHATMSTPEKKQIHRAVVHEMNKVFGPYKDNLLEEDANLDKPLAAACPQDAPWGTQFVIVFMTACVRRYSTLKNLMADGQEDVYRKFILNLKNELAKAVKSATA